MKNKMKKNQVQEFKKNFWKRSLKHLIVGQNQNLCYIEGYNKNNKAVYYIDGLLFSELKRFKKSLGFGDKAGIIF